ncbi:MAG: hypothetical protein K8823_1472 [Cenarchaeum symbiont of Oopsacas minuta]|nr:hypothetical protein [Cenarchaeum symbiont of Oopsacas minuta]
MNENLLAKESSPYLLQHAKNPVDWHGWNSESLQKAKSENKPIFLSVGYSSCHWCHVMAHESFENNDIAQLLNESFVNIKVDREERPDIDDIYQKACQMVTGQGGWPLSVFLTPDQKPFYVGTYFPPLDSYGRPGFGSIVRQLAQAWTENHKDVVKKAEKFVEQMSKPIKSEKITVEKSVIDEAAVNLLQIGDMTYGGFGRAPKFPSAANISFLFRYGQISGISKFTSFALLTLRKMARGGIFDQIGGGFHRYSTDTMWLVPHFEKMLYDNALLSVNYAEAYQITCDEFYLDIMKKTLNYVLKEMTSLEGYFYSAQDADTDGEEGKYYVWSKKEIQDILGKGNDFDAFCLYYDVTDGGNWEGKTILCNNVDMSTVAFHDGRKLDEISPIIEKCAKKLLAARYDRSKLGLDDKMLTSWNSLMITAMAKGARVSNEKKYLDAAHSCLEFIKNKMHHNGQLLHTCRNGNARINAYLDDHAYYAIALLDVFENSPNVEYLERAKRECDIMLEHFWDGEGGFYMISKRDDDLILRPKNDYDLSLPSGNSVAAYAMLRLYHMTHEEKYLSASEAVMHTQARQAAENPFGFGYLLNVIYAYLKKPLEITITGEHSREIASELSSKFLPESILIQIHDAQIIKSLSKYAFFMGKEFTDTPLAYVCRNFVCSQPVNTAQQVLNLVK